MAKLKEKTRKIKAYIAGHRVISAILLIALLASGYFGYKQFGSDSDDVRYLTAKARRGTIVVSVSGTGQVSGENQIDIKSKTSGEVLHIPVREGQKVAPGALIAKLDDENAQKAIRDAEINLESAKIALNKLEIQKSNENLNTDLAKAYDDGFNTVSSAYLDLPGTMTGLGDMFFKADSRTGQWNVDWYEGQVQSVDLEKVKLYKKNFIDSYNAALKAYNANSENYKKTPRAADNQTVEGLIAETYEATKLISDAVKSANNYLDFVNDSIKRGDGNTPAALTTHKASLSAYTTRTNTHLLNLLSIKTSIKEYKDAFQNADLDIQSAELIVRQKENLLQDAKDKLTDYSIRAPFAGTVAKINAKKSDTIGAGAIVAALVSQRELAEISLNEVDAAKIKIGQKARLTFDAIPDLEISGEVMELDAVGEVEQGVVTYIAKISNAPGDERIKPGMSVSAEIITDLKENVLIVPLSAVKSASARGGGRGSYVETLDESIQIAAGVLPGAGVKTPPKKIPVEAGLSNDQEIEIVSGLEEGDEIVVRTIEPSGATAASAPSIFGSPGGGRTGGGVRIQTR